MSTQPMSEPDDDLPPHPDAFRDEQGILDRPAWVAALAEWRGDVKSSGGDLTSAGDLSSGADTEAAPPVGGQGRDSE